MPPGRTEFVWYDREGHRLGTVPAPEGEYVNPTISPDERLIGATRIDPVTGKNSIWTIDVATGAATRLVVDDANSDGLVFSPDGRKVYFGNDRRGRYETYEKPLDGSRSERLVPYPSEGLVDVLAAAPDRLLVLENRGDGERIVLWSPGSPPRALPILQDTGQAILSPDGEWIIFQSESLLGGRRELFVQSLADPGLKYQVTDGGGSNPRFSADGREFYYISQSQELMAVRFTPPALGQPRALFPLRVPNLNYGNADYIPLRDGRFLINTSAMSRQRATATVVVNWNNGEDS